MLSFEWDPIKNEKIKAERNVSFEDVVTAFDADRVLDRINNPNQKRYPGQRILMVYIGDYVYVVPYIEEEKVYFLKTIYPSRAATKKYLRKK